MRILQIGCGALGSLLAQATLAAGHTLTIVRRSDKPVPAGAKLIVADVVGGTGLAALESLEADLLLYCLAPADSGPHAYTETYEQGLRQVLAQLPLQQFKHVFFVSSTRVYGESQGEWLDDDSPAMPADAGGAALRAAEQLLDALPCGHTALRISGIYGPERKYLLRMAHNPASWPPQSAWSNRIHEQDVVGTIVHVYGLLAQGQTLPAHMILTDGVPTLQHEVLQWIATQMGWPLPTTPPAQPQSGKRLRNQRLQQTGYQLKFADYRAGYAAIAQAEKNRQT